MCGGGGGSGGGDEGNMGIDDSVADQSAVSGDTSTVGDDSDDDSTAFGGVSGNQGIGNEVSGSNTQADDEDALSGYEGDNMGLSNQAANQAMSSTLSQAAINSANTDQSQSKDSQSYFASNAVPDAMDFNFANSQAAQNVRDNKDKGSVFRDPQNPFSYAINALSKIGPQNTYNNLSMGQVPTYNAQGQITGTTGQGFGMASGPGNPNPFGPVEGYGVFNATSPSMGMYGGATDIGGNESDNQEIIRRNPNDPVDEIVEERPPLSDDLAVNYLQNPFYLYSGQGNLYQPYGYAANTLVNLLRTRNLTQPQQRAANLGLFGNPGDFS